MRNRCLAGLLAACALAACGSAGGGGDDGPSPQAAPGEVTAREGVTDYPLTVDNCGMEVSFDEPPGRVVLLGDVTVGEVEAFVMLGIHDRILANTQSHGVSDHPDLADRIAAIPTGGLELNDNFAVPAERLLELRPDLVIGPRSGTFDADRGSATRRELAEAGIPSLVTPVQCASGKPDATAEERAALENESVESTYELVRLLGDVFDVPGEADRLIADLQDRLEAVEARVQGRDPKSVLLVYPGMTMMNANGLPAVFAGGVYDDVIRRAGGVNPFAGETLESAGSINEEELARADVDVLVVGQYRADEDPEGEARRLLERFPEWDAARTGTYVTVSDGDDLGPANAWAIEKIARAAHPDAF